MYFWTQSQIEKHKQEKNVVGMVNYSVFDINVDSVFSNRLTG